MVEEHPYPQTSPDTSLFEEATPEYRVNRFAVSQTPGDVDYAQQFPCYPLYRAMVERRYVDGDRVRLDLLKMGVTIRPDTIYAYPALHALKFASEPHRFEAFSTWLSLLPERSYVVPEETLDPLRSIVNILARNLDRAGPLSPPDLRPAMYFAVVCVSKGYNLGFAGTCLWRIMRLADSETAVAFLQDLVAAYKKNTTQIDPGRIADWYTRSIRIQCIAGRYDACFKLLKIALQQRIPVPISETLSYILGRLKARGQMDVLADVAPNMFKPEYASSFSTAQSKKLALVDTPLTPDIGIVKQLRELRIALGSSTPPRATAIASFLLAYRSLGRSRACILLHGKAMRHKATIRGWVMAEMIYHLEMGNPLGALVRYNRVFNPTIIAREKIESVIKEYAPAKRRFLRTQEPQDKLDPSPADTVYAWTALLRLCRRKEEREDLYAFMLSNAEATMRQTPESMTDVLQVGDESPDTSSPETPNLPLSRLERPVPATAGPGLILHPFYFVPFIKEFGYYAGPDRAYRVFNDMAEFGLRADSYCASAVIEVYARYGRLTKVIEMLDRWERQGVVTRAAVRTDVSYPLAEAPSLAVYTAIMQGLVSYRATRGALLIRERLVEKFNYVYGTNPHTDRVFDVHDKLMLRWQKRLRKRQEPELSQAQQLGSSRTIHPSTVQLS